MMGTSTAAATSAKCRATASELIFGIRGGLIMTAAAPAPRARRVSSMQVRSPSAVAPATTGTRPFTCSSTVSSTRSRSASVSRATSLVTPSAVKPFTPSARNRSMTRLKLSGSKSPLEENGVGRTEKTPPNAMTGDYRMTVASHSHQWSAVGGLDGDEDVAALTVDEQQQRLVAGTACGRAQIVDRLHRLPVGLLNDVAPLDARVGRTPVGIHVL